MSGGVFILLGYLQYFFYTDLRGIFHLGWDEHLYRLTSTFLDPNFAGIFIVLVLFLYIYMFKDFLLNWRTIKSNPQYFAGLISILIAIFLTYSRSTIITLLLTSVGFLWFVGKKKVILLILIAAFLLTLIVPNSYGKLYDQNLFRKASISERYKSAENAFTIFTNSPFIGVGFNSYRYAQEKYGYLSGPKWEVTHSGSGSSNSFLLILATTGVLGGITFILFWYYLLKPILKIKDSNAKKLLLISLSAIFIHSMLENTFFYIFIQYWIFILIGLFLDKNPELRSKKT
jgi:O-antigen ligase